MIFIVLGGEGDGGGGGHCTFIKVRLHAGLIAENCLSLVIPAIKAYWRGVCWTMGYRAENPTFKP